MDIDARLDLIESRLDTIVALLTSTGGDQATARQAAKEEIRGGVDLTPIEVSAPSRTHQNIISGIVSGRASKYRVAWFYTRLLLDDGKWRLASDLADVYTDLFADDPDYGILPSSYYGMLTAAGSHGLLERNVPPRLPTSRRRGETPLAYRLGTPKPLYSDAVALARVDLDEWDIDDVGRTRDTMLAFLRTSDTYHRVWLGDDGQGLTKE